MDSKDFQLLVALCDNGRQSYQSLGRRVFLSAPAVRDRLERLKEKGILQGFMLVINPSVFDRVGLLLFFPGDFQRKTVLAALAAPDVAWAALKLDGRMVVGLWTNDEEKSVRYLTNILGTKPSGRAFAPNKKSAPLSIIDLSIMDALVDEPKLSVGEIVKSTRLSPKTVRKHLDQLVETKVISIEPRLGALIDSGDLIYHLLVIGNVSMSKVRRIMGEVALINRTQQPLMRYMLCRASSLTEVVTKTHALQKTRGIESVTLSLNREVLVSSDLRHSLIRKEIQKLKKNRKKTGLVKIVWMGPKVSRPNWFRY